MGSVISALPKSYLDSGASLAVALYQLSGEGWYLDEAYATAAILILLVLGINALTERLSRRLIPSAK
jgi:phosphate transport system permease protein